MNEAQQSWWYVSDEEIDLTPEEEWEEESKYWGYPSRWPEKGLALEPEISIKKEKTMNKSETIAKLAAALSKAQGELNPAKKKGENPYFKSTYATLEAVWDACRDVLKANDLAVIQSPQLHEESVCLETLLTHSSGEWIRSLMPLMLTKQDPQTMGSALTYARRYALSAMVGITQSDDDGERAMKPVRDVHKAAPPIYMKEMKATISAKIELEHPEHLEEYLKFCKSKVDKPMREVIDSWVSNPEPFKAHYAKWVSKKYVDKTEEVEEDGDRAPSFSEEHA